MRLLKSIRASPVTLQTRKLRPKKGQRLVQVTHRAGLKTRVPAAFSQSCPHSAVMRTDRQTEGTTLPVLNAEQGDMLLATEHRDTHSLGMWALTDTQG